MGGGGFLKGLDELEDNGLPGESLRGLSGGITDRWPLISCLESAFHGLDKSIGLVKGSEETVDAVDDVEVGRGIIIGDDDETARHGLGDNVSEGFGRAGKDKKISGGVMSGKVFAVFHSGVLEFWEIFFEFGEFGAVADKNGVAAGDGLADFAKGFCGEGEILFRGEIGRAHV